MRRSLGPLKGTTQKGLLGGDWLPWILAYFPILIGNNHPNWLIFWHLFPEILGFYLIIPIDELHHFAEGWPKTTNQRTTGTTGADGHMEKHIWKHGWKRWRDTRYGSQISRNGVELWRLWSTYRSRRMDVFFLWMEVLTMVFEQPRMEIYVKVIDGYIMESWEESNHMKWRYHGWISPPSWISHP